MATDAKDDNVSKAQAASPNPPTKTTAPPRPFIAPDGEELAEDDPNLGIWSVYYHDLRGH